MMRTRLSFAMLMAVAGPGAPALAQESFLGRTNMDMVGSAPSACLISGAARGTGANAVLTAAGGQQASIRIVELVDPNTAQARPTAFSLSLPVICNVSHQLSVRTQNGGLSRDDAVVSPTPSGFRDALPYEVTARWAGRVVSGQSATPFELIAPDAVAGDLAIDIEISPGGDPLVAGSYSDQLVVELRVAT